MVQRTNEYFYAEAFQTLVKRWDKCINVAGEHVENKCSVHSLKFVLLYYELKSPGVT